MKERMLAGFFGLGFVFGAYALLSWAIGISILGIPPFIGELLGIALVALALGITKGNLGTLLLLVAVVLLAMAIDPFIWSIAGKVPSVENLALFSLTINGVVGLVASLFFVLGWFLQKSVLPNLKRRKDDK